ncbi:hypothetical protein AB3M89_14850 [Microbacterium sp. 179-I 3D2 NHS]|uniref:hypothetical protein n=1 Tax=Microbacterium sp. 179-I 3D2 NHS TaxID=3235178 RepID=UPI0039A2B161
MSFDSDRIGSDGIDQEKPEADRQEQERDVEQDPEVDATTPPPLRDDAEADAADLADQRAEVPLDEDRPRT